MRNRRSSGKGLFNNALITPHGPLIGSGSGLSAAIDVRYNLFQMPPTLYRSALPDDGVLLLLDPLEVRTVITFLPRAG